MSVTKTLVVGLGSSGCDICNSLAKRIKWELGSLSRAPWIRFLCIETNVGKDVQLIPELRKDFFAATVPAQEYESVIENPEAYAHIDLMQWADLELLAQLPNKEVTVGAGNIRMVGRLVFMLRRDLIRDRLLARLRDLRTLTPIQATNARGPLPSGEDPPVVFGAGENPRIIVTGTLCGGTCSGFASDFGFLLREICDADDKTIAIFTIANPVASANRFKRNSYQALVELNEYHVIGPRGHAFGPRTETRDYPYDAVYLAAPSESLETSIRSLHDAIADRIFLNAFVPEVDPFDRLVDAGFIARDDRAHVFCSFGSATLEYPAQQILEACAKRLMAFALREWNLRPSSDFELTERLHEIGITWDSLRSALINAGSGESISVPVERMQREIVELSGNDVGQAQSKLNILRQAFFGAYSGSAPDPLPSGSIRHRIMSNREAVANMTIDSLRHYIRTNLCDFHQGPAKLRDLLHKVSQRLSEISQTSEPQIGEIVAKVDRDLNTIKRYRRSLKLFLFSLRKPAVERAKTVLFSDLATEVKLRFDIEIIRAIRNQALPSGQYEPGVIELITRMLNPIINRVDELRRRVDALATLLQEESNTLAEQRPAINGFCLFEPEETVNTAYNECLRQIGRPGDTLEAVEQRAAAEILRLWEQLPEAVAPVNVNSKTWLDTPRQLRTDIGIPDEDIERMLSRAADMFRYILQRDVLEELMRTDLHWKQKAHSVQAKAEPFVQVNEALALKGIRAYRERLPGREIVIVPDSRYADEFVEALAPYLRPDRIEIRTQQRNRVVILREIWRWALHGSPQITGSNGLATASAGDFIRWDTRKDIAWHGITDGELERLRETRSIIAVAILCGVLRLRQNALVMDDVEGIVLPPDPEHAASSLVQQVSSRAISAPEAVVTILKAQIEARRRNAGVDVVFVTTLMDSARTQLPGFVNWDRAWFERQVRLYCTAIPELKRAYDEVDPPNRELINSLWRQKGTRSPRGFVYPDDGFYCPHCDACIGTTEQEANSNDWMCPVYPTEHRIIVRLREANTQ